MYSLELANSKELEVCYEIIEEGRAFQKEQGFVQWTEAYPNRDTIEADIEKKKGYVIKADKDILGYMCIDFDGEPAYDDINGAWRSDAPYAVVHRMAFSNIARGKGIADIAFGLIDELCINKGVKYIRVDTDFPNKRMQHILKKNGYVYCGTIVFQNGDKLAYDKLL
ncbi:MAG: GNAT family N-acetyltransferase [Veillonella sp.]|uniref:GNAT family N-acetyltransferase n=1 Tax=Veillonella sp. TaxID=1926307 RepID=UPI0025EAB63E|nr:GNAT family N-acetyltransferase [Veillonella sp.]MBE6079519.1 GNAT family N-acetyltransferase [Veillonella sp.]